MGNNNNTGYMRRIQLDDNTNVVWRYTQGIIPCFTLEAIVPHRSASAPAELRMWEDRRYVRGEDGTYRLAAD